MPSKIRQHFKASGKKDYLFGLDLINPTIKFKKDGSFQLKTETPKDHRHEWVSRDGARGRLSGRHLARERWWTAYTADRKGRGDLYNSKDGLASDRGVRDRKVIGVMPSGQGTNLFMYEMDRVRHKGGDLIINGHVLSKDFMHDHAREISAAYGSSTLHNHLKFQKYLPEALEELSEADSTRKQRRVRASDADVPTSTGRPLAIFGSSGLGGVMSDISGGLGDLGGAIEDTAGKAGEVLQDTAHETGEVLKDTANETVEVIEDAAEVIEETAKETAEVVEDTITDVADQTFETLVSTAENLADYAVYGYEWVKDLLTGAVELSFDLTWDELSLNYNKGPFSSRLGLQPSMAGKVRLSEGYAAAAFDHSTISFSVEPRFDLIGDVRLDLGRAGVGYSKTIQGPSRTTAAPVIGQATVSTEIDVSFAAGVSLGEDVGFLGATLHTAPAVGFTMSGTRVNFADRSKPPSLTPDLGPFTADNLAPSTRVSLTVTPKVKFIAGPRIPDDVPFVGGMDLATLDVTIANPIPFTYDPAKPSQFDVATSANATSQFNFMGARVSPQLMNEPLYGPETVTIQL